MRYCEPCGRKVREAYDASTGRKVILDVDQKVYTPVPMTGTVELRDGFRAIRNSLCAAVHLCQGPRP